MRARTRTRHGIVFGFKPDRNELPHRPRKPRRPTRDQRRDKQRSTAPVEVR